MSIISFAKKILLIILFCFLILFLFVIYRAYVVFKPCQHHINPIETNQRIKVSSDQISRLQRAIAIRTVSLSIGYENKEAKIDFVNFIRAGLKPCF